MSWKQTLTPYQRERVCDLHRTKPLWNLVPFVFVGIWAAAGALVLAGSFWPVRLAGYLIIGASINALGILMHEAIHGSMFRNAAADRCAGFLLGLPLAMSAYAYRVVHHVHHRHTRSEADPDEFGNLTGNPKMLSVAFYAWLIVGGPIYFFHVPVTALRLGTRRDRIAVLTEYALMAGAYAAAFVYVPTAILTHCWLYPLLAVFVFANVRGWSEHTMTTPGNPLTESRTVTSNRLVSFFMCNLNYHLEHHLYPAVPWYNLPKLHKLLQLQYRIAGSCVYTSYLRFMWDAARTGVHGTAMDASRRSPGLGARDRAVGRRREESPCR